MPTWQQSGFRLDGKYFVMREVKILERIILTGTRASLPQNCLKIRCIILQDPINQELDNSRALYVITKNGFINSLLYWWSNPTILWLNQKGNIGSLSPHPHFQWNVNPFTFLSSFSPLNVIINKFDNTNPRIIERSLDFRSRDLGSSSNGNLLDMWSWGKKSVNCSKSQIIHD